MTPLPAPARLRRLERLERLDACDASGGIVTTITDTVSCSWIFYSECRSDSTPPPRLRLYEAALRGKLAARRLRRSS